MQLGDVQKGIDVPQFHKRFLSAAGDAGHGEHLAIHGKMHLYRAELHAVHPLRVVLVGGTWVAGKHALQGSAVAPYGRATALPGRRLPDGGCGSAR